jgi:hypothetical protein
MNLIQAVHKPGQAAITYRSNSDVKFVKKVSASRLVIGRFFRFLRKCR